MKLTRCLFIIAGFGALTLGVFAGEPASQSSKAETRENQNHSAAATAGNQARGKMGSLDGKLSKPKIDGQASKKIGQAGPLNIEPQRAPLNRLPQTELNKTGPAARPGVTISKTGNHLIEPPKLPVGSGTIAPSARMIRDRGASTAVIGGSAASNVKNSSAAVNGAGIKRKP